MLTSLLTEKLQSVFKTLRGYGKLSESNVADAVREVRLALLAADVNYQVAKDICDQVKAKCLGAEVLLSVKPSEQFIKIFHDELIARFAQGERDLTPNRPLRILLCGLNGAGKTTTAAKLALHFKKERQQVLLIAGDLARPAAIQQLQTLGKTIGVNVATFPEAKSVAEVAQLARKEAEFTRSDVIIFDSAGRLDIDDDLLTELEGVAKIWEPQETLLVADAATGQTAVQVAQAFSVRVKLTGLVLSKFDGDAKGGAALSLQHTTQCPIKFLGVSEKPEGLEVFDPERLVRRMLGFGDIVGLVEKAQKAFDLNSMASLEQKFKKNSFDLQDFLNQLKMIQKMGPLENLLGLVPGMPKLPSSATDGKSLKRVEAMILSMTPRERHNPDILNGRRRARIAKGSGTHVSELNDTLRRFEEMKRLMSRVAKSGNPMKQLQQMMGRR